MKCPRCGTEMDERANFCPVCGEHMSPTGAQPGGNGGYSAPAPIQYRAPITSRNIALAVILSIVTCGIYGLYWIYCLVNDLNTASGHEGDTGGGMMILLSIVTCNIYAIYWVYTAGAKVNEIHAFNGKPQDNSLGVVYLLLQLFGFGIVNYALIQNELNKVAGL